MSSIFLLSVGMVMGGVAVSLSELAQHYDDHEESDGTDYETGGHYNRLSSELEDLIFN